jgi:hypothetical protein
MGNVDHVGNKAGGSPTRAHEYLELIRKNQKNIGSPKWIGRI